MTSPADPKKVTTLINGWTVLGQVVGLATEEGHEFVSHSAGAVRGRAYDGFRIEIGHATQCRVFDRSGDVIAIPHSLSNRLVVELRSLIEKADQSVAMTATGCDLCLANPGV